MDEKLLIARAQSGSRSAIEWLLKINSPKIMGTIVKMTRDEHLANDIFQDMCVKVLLNIKSFDGRSSFSSWAIQIAKNLFIDECRKRKIRDTKGVVPTSFGDDNEINVELSEVLDAFTPHERELILLKYHYGYTYEEIGERLSIKTGTVRSRIHYAVKRIKRSYHDE